jgi:hypothetical protein
MEKILRNLIHPFIIPNKYKIETIFTSELLLEAKFLTIELNNNKFI